MSSATDASSIVLDHDVTPLAGHDLTHDVAVISKRSIEGITPPIAAIGLHPPAVRAVAAGGGREIAAGLTGLDPGLDAEFDRIQRG